MWQLVLIVVVVVQSIVVERNSFAYYKVPFSELDDVSHTYQHQQSRNDSRLYYVLQCPPKVNDTIPRPEDMQTCNVIEQYRELWRPQLENKQPKAKTTSLSPILPTQGKRLHMIPFKIVLRPLKLRWPRRPRSKRQNTSPVAKIGEETALANLGRHHPKQQKLKLAADHMDFKRGSRTKGYQHIYHRDETYNDHIFYDEMKRDGKWDNYGKSVDEY